MHIWDRYSESWDRYSEIFLRIETSIPKMGQVFRIMGRRFRKMGHGFRNIYVKCYWVVGIEYWVLSSQRSGWRGFAIRAGYD
jgi:hypothetical protein